MPRRRTNAAQAANANTVGGVPAEALTIRRSGFDDLCEPGVAAIKCATVTLGLPRLGRVLVTPAASGTTTTQRAPRSAVSAGSSTTARSSRSRRRRARQQTDGNQEQTMSAQTIVTNVLAAGDHEFSLSCSDDVGDMDYTDTRISAVLLRSS
jgi:hypothetical protein